MSIPELLNLVLTELGKENLDIEDFQTLLHIAKSLEHDS